MIQGLLTRPVTDAVVRPFVTKISGSLHQDGPSFESVDNAKPIACFGVLRGTGDVMSRVKDFYYFDHAYMFGERHGNSKIFGERIYRLTKNYQHIREIKKLKKSDYERIEKYQPHVKYEDFKYDGKYILICELSEFAKEFYKAHNWLDDTIKEIKKNTRKEIVVRKKEDKSNLKKQINEAYAVVSFQSTVCIDAVLSGVPSFTSKYSMGVPVSLQDFSLINDPLYPMDRKPWINSLLANQFTMTEISNGTAWKAVNDTHS